MQCSRTYRGVVDLLDFKVSMGGEATSQWLFCLAVDAFLTVIILGEGSDWHCGEEHWELIEFAEPVDCA